jgi:hypothetical protein
MKYSNLTYYLLTILCMMAVSCSTDGGIDDFPDTKEPILVKDAQINFVFTLPTDPSTRASEDDGLKGERTIDNIHVYTFQDYKLVEEIQYFLIDGKDGDIRRNINGKLSETYDATKPMEFVVIVNAENRGVNNLKINKGQKRADFYKQLSFDFNKNQDWSTNIPMWGMGTITKIKTGENNFGTLELVRAIAKVNVTVADGAGLENFEITEIRLHHYNTKGYCTRIANQSPSIPDNSTIAGDTEYLTSGPLSGKEGNRFENKFYIPEHKNIGITDESKKVYLTINAKVRGVEKTYTVQFSTNGKPYDVLRNHLYVFNITSVDNVTASLNYEVKQWEYITVDVPAFN